MKETEQPRTGESVVDRYPPSLRLLHWTRAVLILGLITVGWTMTYLADEVPAKYGIFYPWHKSVGLLAFLVIVVQLIIRARTPDLLEPPEALTRGERFLAKFVHRAIYVLLVLVPVMGYSMSSTYTMSDGVYFFGTTLPELLPKNDNWFAVFQWLHKVLAYSLLGLIALHVAGAIKHRFFDRTRAGDVLHRML
jgi:cytochrome b561